MAHTNTQTQTLYTQTKLRNKFDFHVQASAKNRCYGWVPIQPSQPKQAIPRTSFDFNVFFSGKEVELVIWR